MHITNYKLEEISPEIINFINQDGYKLNDKKILGLKGYLIAKGLFMYFFKNRVEDANFIYNYDYLIEIYKKNIELSSKELPRYNLYLKMYNKYKILPDDHMYDIHENNEYLCLDNLTIIKIKNKKSIIHIEKRLDNNKLFIAKKDDNIILSYGTCTNIDIDNESIDKFFKNSIADSEIKKYYKYNKIKIIYWVSVFI